MSDACFRECAEEVPDRDVRPCLVAYEDDTAKRVTPNERARNRCCYKYQAEKKQTCDMRELCLKAEHHHQPPSPAEGSAAFSLDLNRLEVTGYGTARPRTPWKLQDARRRKDNDSELKQFGRGSAMDEPRGNLSVRACKWDPLLEGRLPYSCRLALAFL